MTTTRATATVRQSNDRDTARLAALRRAWSEELAGGPLGDSDFEAGLAEWYAAEATRRVTFLAEVDDHAVGMVNLAIFNRMPKPARTPSHWCYLANAFVLAPYRDRGIGTALLDAAVAHARGQGSARIVLAPSERALPFYQQAGFGPASMLLAMDLD